MMKKKSGLYFFIGFITLIVVLCFVVIKLTEVREQKEYARKVADEIEQVNIFAKNFDTETQDEQKLKILKEVKLAFQIYQDEEAAGSVIDAYENLIEQSKRYFIESNSKAINNAKIEHLDNETKETIAQSINSLKNVLETILAQRSIVYDNDRLDDTKNDINGLIDAYNEQLDQINIAEEKAKEEAKLKQEAKEKAKQEAEWIAQQEQSDITQSEVTDSYNTNDHSENTTYAANETVSGNNSSGSSNANDSSLNGGAAAVSPPSTTPNGSVSDEQTSYGWSATVDGSNRVETTTKTDGNGNFEAEVNGESIGGWSID